jgi:hypothetical protein
MVFRCYSLQNHIQKASFNQGDMQKLRYDVEFIQSSEDIILWT